MKKLVDKTILLQSARIMYFETEYSSVALIVLKVYNSSTQDNERGFNYKLMIR